jgi:uncharacterized membrane protein YesL
MMGSPLTRINVRADAWDLIWSFVHRALTVNLGLVIACSPLLLALASVADPLSYPLFFGLLGLTIGPALAASFGYLQGDDASVRSLFRSYRRRLARRSLLPWALTLSAVSILLSDITGLHDRLPGAALVPLLALLAFLALGTGLTIQVLLATNPSLPVRSLLRVAAYTTVRRAHLTLLSLAVLAAATVIVNQVPLAGLATVPGCALWVVLTNTKLQLDRVLSR